MKKKMLTGLALAGLLMVSGCSSAGQSTSTEGTTSQSETGNSDAAESHNSNSEQAEETQEYELPVLVNSGYETGIDACNQFYSRIYAEVENPNPDLEIEFVAVDCVARDKENRIVGNYLLTFRNIAPSSKAIAFEMLVDGVPSEFVDDPTDDYTYEFSIDMTRQITGWRDEDKSESVEDYITVSNIQHNDSTLFPELSFDFTNTDDIVHSYVNFLIQYLKDDKIVNQVETCYDYDIKPGETYVMNPFLATMFPADFDEVRVIPTEFTSYMANPVILNEAVTIVG